MSDIWPDNLVEELAYRRCLIFLGSGISATAKMMRENLQIRGEHFLIM